MGNLASTHSGEDAVCDSSGPRPAHGLYCNVCSQSYTKEQMLHCAWCRGRSGYTTAPESVSGPTRETTAKTLRTKAPAWGGISQCSVTINQAIALAGDPTTRRTSANMNDDSTPANYFTKWRPPPPNSEKLQERIPRRACKKGPERRTWRKMGRIPRPLLSPTRRRST
jgi:hypothetical protein